jgi:hypothetical protein
MKRILTAFCFVILILGCSTDFDVIAPYKEVMVVDGLLNAFDSVQHVKVGKAFLGEGNAYVMAEQSDSIYYGDVLDVKMERILNNQVLETFFLSRVESNDKDSGVFAYPYRVSYETSQEIHDEDASEYRITITNRETGNSATSRTKVVKDMLVTSLYTDSIDWATASNSPVILSFNPNPNGKSNARIFDMIIRFHYRDIDPSGVSTTKKIDWNFLDQTSSNDNLQEVKFIFYKYDFYKIIGQNIPVIPGYTRRTDSLPPGIKPIEVIFLQGSEDLQTYLQLRQPTTGVVQELPLFTTVDNGLGLFTSRIVHPEFRFMDSDTEAAFDTSVYTRDLNFQFD